MHSPPPWRNTRLLGLQVFWKLENFLLFMDSALRTPAEVAPTHPTLSSSSCPDTQSSSHPPVPAPASSSLGPLASAAEASPETCICSEDSSLQGLSCHYSKVSDHTEVCKGL